ncbi:MAG: six-hairpin glycosidase [Bacteroidaceae bacterium]|nr:six-hairpin glycosidase [Bacteroidaceae bacterium]
MAKKEIVENLKKYNSESAHYTGKTLAYPARHDGGLSPVVGVHNIQTMRGSLNNGDNYNSSGGLYNHQPMIAWWNNKYFIHYLVGPRHEHEQPCCTMFQTSTDGYSWSKPAELFPAYPVPDGFRKQGMDYVAKDLKSVMHQRVGWYVSKDRQTLVAIGNHGIVMHPKDDPNDGNGVGRVVRQVNSDGTLGPIYFLHYNHDFNEKNTIYPFYKKAKNKAFVKACDEILADPMQRMQWAEESDRNDPILPLATPAKAFSGYTLPDGRKIGLWKHALTSVSFDGGNTWRTPLNRAHGFVNSNAKIWGQRLSDGTYATVYNPSEYRWPLAISLSADGLEYTTLNLISGDVTPERHYGLYKSFGPQYVRGVQESNPQPADGNLWLTYSMNKEDMWVARVPVPVKLAATHHADDDFSAYKSLADMKTWNIYSPLCAPVALDGKWLTLSDSEVYDYARVEKVIPATKELTVEFDVKAKQTDHGQLNIEFTDAHGNVAAKIILDSTATMRVKGGARSAGMVKGYKADEIYHVKAVLSQDLHNGVYYVNGKKAAARQFDTPVESITRIVFRTGEEFKHPTIETPADQTADMPRADEFDPTAVFAIANLKTYPTTDIATQATGAAVLNYDNYAHYAEKFNTMEDENIVQAIPNAEASAWMEKNIPLFDCPDKQFEEIYYYRWWTLRKHIKRTPVGYGMTEFLVPRSYADRYNLIACAIGHHINECRWLRDKTYLNQILNTWYFGNDGKAMTKMSKFSSWNPFAVYNAYKVNGDTAMITKLLPALEEEYARWKSTNRLDNGLYWQGDVQDGMEESISGGRKKKYARPTINSYMTANAFAIADMKALLQPSATDIEEYRKDGEKQWQLIQDKLWNQEQQFFETHRGDSSANVREAIGYMPWYCELPTNTSHDTAWLQLTDEKGFRAPFGLTTAERRHPLFRSHGTGTCEWDGAIWPFATSQTLTALANYLNSTDKPVIGDSIFFNEMLKYAESQHYRGKPYIGEYLDETTGYWLMGDRERSRYYNHSTFCDLVITGLVGLRPSANGDIIVNPLIPEGKWDYFCLDNLSYRGHNITILYDKDGQRYHQGKGLRILVDGISAP